MEALQRIRNIHRSVYTKRASKVEELCIVPVREAELRAAFEQLTMKAELLFSCDEKIRQHWADSGTSEKDILEDSEVTDDIELGWLIIKGKVNNLLSMQHTEYPDNSSVRSYITRSEATRHDRDSEVGSHDGHVKRQFKLPKIELKKFDGNIKNWLSFWGQFKKINDDRSLDDDDKFQYLYQATEPGTSARELIESFPPSGENYHKAVAQLKSRFARDELLVQNYVRELIDLVLSQSREHIKMDLRILYDKLNTQLRALETFGVTSDKYAAMLYPLVESAIPEETLRVWERTRVTREGNDELSTLLIFLKSEVECEERIQMAKTGFSSTTTNLREPSATCLLSAINKDESYLKINEEKRDALLCIWCNKPSHNSVQCLKLNKMNLEEKKEHIMSKKGCYICLKLGHPAKTCKSFPKCLLCSKRHSIVMCPQLPDKAEGSTSSNSCDNQPSNNEALLCQSVTLLQTIILHVKCNNNVMKDLDPETQLYITAGVLGAACLVLIVLVSVLYTRVAALGRRVDDMQVAGKLRVQKLRNASSHAFQNPALAPDEELSKRGYSMYQPSEPDLESQRDMNQRDTNQRDMNQRDMNPRHSQHPGPAYVEELTRELDSRQHTSAPSFLLTAIQENKRKSKHLNNPMAKETRGSSDTNPNFMY